jgi:hypothetical protein
MAADMGAITEGALPFMARTMEEDIRPTVHTMALVTQLTAVTTVAEVMVEVMAAVMAAVMAEVMVEVMAADTTVAVTACRTLRSDTVHTAGKLMASQKRQRTAFIENLADS